MAESGLPEDGPLALLHRALHGSSEAQRPLARLKLPLKLDHFLTPASLARLRAAAVLVPITAGEGAAGPGVLLTRRSETLRQHKGQISFPGGRRDDTDSNLTAAALREAQEEVGLDPANVRVIGYLDDYPTLTGYRITPVVGQVLRPFTPAIDPGEVAEIFELPLTVLLAKGSFQRKLLSREGLQVPLVELRYAGHRIWGATAGILWNLRQKLLGRDD